MAFPADLPQARPPRLFLHHPAPPGGGESLSELVVQASILIIFGGRGTPEHSEFHTVELQPAVGTCCGLPSRLCISWDQVRLRVRLVGRSGPQWRIQSWQAPAAQPHPLVRRDDNGLVEDPLITLWRGNAMQTNCWRLGIVNPSAVRPETRTTNRKTETDEKPVPLTPAEFDAVLEIFGCYLSFPADRNPHVRSEADGNNVHRYYLSTLAAKARQQGRYHGSNDLELLTFLLKTGSVHYERVEQEVQRRSYTHIGLPRPFPLLQP